MANNKFIRNIKIEADAGGNAPTTLQLLTVGSWNTPWHGDFDISPSDIDQFVSNYKANIGLPDDSDGKIQVNYGHTSYDKAAGWMSNLRAEDVDGRYSLVSDVEWTPAAIESIQAGEWRYISPEFNPRALPWEDPEEEWRMVANVITGAGLTNIPLFKKLKKVAASERPSEPEGSSNKQTKGERMTFKLEDLRVKKASEINADERTFLESKKSELTADELTALDIKADDKGPQKVEADVKGQVTISASELAELKASAAQGVAANQRLAEKEASDFADARISAGQIKSDEKANLVKLLLASEGDSRTALEDFVSGLPENDKLKKVEVGEDVAVGSTATDELNEKASKIQADSNVSYTKAVKQVLASDKDLRARVEAERK